MNVKQITAMILWLAVLGAIVLYGSRLAGNAAAKVRS